MAIPEKGLNLRLRPMESSRKPPEAKLGRLCGAARKCTLGKLWLILTAWVQDFEQSTFLHASVSSSVKWD